jgi:hypothetical protein
MLKRMDENAFEPINRAYNTVFRQNQLTVGLVAPLARISHQTI